MRKKVAFYLPNSSWWWSVKSSGEFTESIDKFERNRGINGIK